MKKKLFLGVVWVFALPCFVSCGNIWSPFQGAGSDQDHIELAQKCLHDNDLTCARNEYNKLTDGAVKYQKLCTLDLTQAGFTLNTMINTLTQSDASMLGAVANSIIPYTQAKLEAAEEAIKTGGPCDLFMTATSSNDLSVLLRSIAYIAHCGVLIAKVDQLTATSQTSTTGDCTTPGRKAGKVLSTDIADNADGSITSHGMCPDDVFACRDDMNSLSALKGQISAKFADIKAAYDAIPAAILQAGGDAAKAQIVRNGIQSTLSATRL